MKLKHLFVAGLLALTATALVGCDKDDTSSDSTPPATPAHTHAFVKGECECGDIQTPTVDVKGKTYMITDMVAVYEEGNAPTTEQKQACEYMLAMSKTYSLGGKYVFGTDGKVTMTPNANAPMDPSEYPVLSYVQKGDFIFVTVEEDVTELTLENTQWVSTEKAGSADSLQGYTGFSIKTVFTLESEHQHAYVQGVCFCGDAQAPTVSIAGKTYTVSAVTPVYDPTNPPSSEQQKACEDYIASRMGAQIGIIDYAFGTDNTVSVYMNTQNLGSYAYVQQGDWVIVKLSMNDTLVLTLEGSTWISVENYADEAEDLEGYTGLSIKCVFTLAEE